MTKIKICGITNYEDAKNAADLGADFLGFNFYGKSPRYINYKKAKDIIEKLNGKASIVGVFVNEKIERISEIFNHCNLDLIQLSGDEDSQYTDKLKNSINKKIIKAFRIKNNANSLKDYKLNEFAGLKIGGQKSKILTPTIFNKINNNLISSFNYDYIMLDSFKEGFYGGTGENFDLDSVKGIDTRKLFLAGGLNDKNVQSTVKKLNPFAVDVCSSIESEPGKKDYNKMKKFIGAIK